VQQIVHAKVYFCIGEILKVCTTHKSSVNTGLTEQIMPFLRYKDSLVTRMVVGLTTAKFTPLILYAYIYIDAARHIENIYTVMCVFTAMLPSTALRKYITIFCHLLHMHFRRILIFRADWHEIVFVLLNAYAKGLPIPLL
jgi:hypothetical protein